MTFSRLTLGDPRLKSKLRGGSVSSEPPCEEPLTTGANIFPYDDFEDVLSQQGGGPNGNEIPYRDVRDLYWPSEFDSDTSTDGTLITTLEGGPTDPYHLVQNSPGGDAGVWVMSTTNPDAGTYHARVERLETSGSVPSLIFFRLAPCPESGGPVQNFRGSGGLIVTINYRAAANAGSPSGGIGLAFYDQGQNFITSTGTDTKTFTTSYSNYQTSHTLPSSTWYWTCTFTVANSDLGTFDLDNITVGLE